MHSLKFDVSDSGLDGIHLLTVTFDVTYLFSTGLELDYEARLI